MRIDRIPPSFVYFLSGTSAAAAVNFLTSIPASELNRVQSLIVAGFAIPWLGASLMLALTAALLEEGQLKCAKLTSQRLNELEDKEVRAGVFAEFRGGVLRRAGAALLFFCLGIGGVFAVNLRDYADAGGKKGFTDEKLPSRDAPQVGGSPMGSGQYTQPMATSGIDGIDGAEQSGKVHDQIMEPGPK